MRLMHMLRVADFTTTATEAWEVRSAEGEDLQPRIFDKSFIIEIWMRLGNQMNLSKQDFLLVFFKKRCFLKLKRNDFYFLFFFFHSQVQIILK